MTFGPNDESPDSMPMQSEDDGRDPALDALLRRVDRGAPAAPLDDLEARILSAATFPLAARRRNARSDARTGMADALAAWMRVALPLAAAAALFATLSLSRVDGTTTSMLADAELSESDPAALLSALESTGSSGLARHVISTEAANAIGYDLESR